jgi:hypothetical protein
VFKKYISRKKNRRGGGKEIFLGIYYWTDDGWPLREKGRKSFFPCPTKRSVPYFSNPGQPPFLKSWKKTLFPFFPFSTIKKNTFITISPRHTSRVHPGLLYLLFREKKKIIPGGYTTSIISFLKPIEFFGEFLIKYL